MAEVVDLTALSSDDDEQPARSTQRTDAPKRTIDLTFSSDEEGPPTQRARRETAARPPVAPGANGPLVIVSWNAYSILPNSGNNRDKAMRFLQRLGKRPDAIVVTECTVQRKNERAARSAFGDDYTCFFTHVQDRPKEHKGAGVAFYVRRDSVLASNGRLLPSAPWDRWGMIGQYSCSLGVIVGAYLPTPTTKDAELREALDDEWPLLLKSHRHRLICFCGDLNATVSRTLDATTWFSGTRYDASRRMLENAVRDLRLIDVVRNKWPATARYTAFQSRPDKNQYWRARPDHFLVPQGRSSLVELVVVPYGEPWVRRLPATERCPERFISIDKEGTLCGSDHVPIIVTMRLA